MKALQGFGIRGRLTLLYMGLLSVILVLYAAGASAFLLRNLRLQLDHRLNEDIETIEGLLAWDGNGHLQLMTGNLDKDARDLQPHYLEAWSSGGAVLYRSPRLGQEDLGPAPGPLGSTGRMGPLSVRLAATRVRIIGRRHSVSGTPVRIRLGLSEEPLWGEFWQMVSVLAIGLPVALLLIGGAGYAVARRALRPLDAMAKRAEKITAEKLEERLPIANPGDELGHLGRVFNETLARLERSFEQLRRFTADASHELRTPLTAIRSVGEVSLQRRGDAEYYRDIVGSMLEEANRLTKLVDSLLTMSRADAGRIPLQPSEFSVLDLAKEAGSLIEVLAEEKNQTMTIDGDPQVVVRGDRLILRQALINLLDNAVKYSPEGGRVDVRAGTRDGEAFVDVRDSGPGIPSEHRSKVFDRFYRLDKSRSREEGGAGLGLSISQWAVEAHGGRIELDCDHGPGCTFRMNPGRSEPRCEDPRENIMKYAITLLFILAGIAASQDSLTLKSRIDLPNVNGRIDHFSTDVKGRRLFVSALGNRTVEVLDTESGKRLHSISDVAEPQGLFFDAATNRLFVASMGDGTTKIYDGSSFQLLKAVKFPSNADNIRYDATHRTVIVGFGSGALGLLDVNGNAAGEIALDSHPESFQLEKSGGRVFVNIPNAKEIQVVDLARKALLARWPVTSALRNFPMALDEGYHRLIVGCREPARMLVFDTATGKQTASAEIVDDTDDLFYDAAKSRIYIIGGGGFVDVFEQKDPDHYNRIQRLQTAVGARTGLFVPDWDRLFVAVPRRGEQLSKILIYETK
jgi:heavy metal sensor kinase